MNPQIKQAKLREEFRKIPINNQIIWGSMNYVQQETMREQFELIADWWLAKLSQAKLETLEAIIKEVEGMIGVHFGGKSDPIEYFHDSQGRMKAVEYLKNIDLLTKLQAEKELTENEI